MGIEEGGDILSPPTLNPVVFIQNEHGGCNTPQDIIRAQMRLNVERDLPWLEMEPVKDKPLVLVGGGPSLEYRWPEMLSHEGDIMALNGSYRFLLDKQIIPNYFMLLDARQENIEFVKNPQPDVRHFIAAQCHPGVFDALVGFNTTLYLTIHPDTLEIVKHINKPVNQIAGTVGTVGIKALCLGYALGYRKFHLYGYDSSYASISNGPSSPKIAHHAYPQAMNDESRRIDIHIEGKRFDTSVTMANQAQEFVQFAIDMTRIYGCEIELHCDGLLPAVVAQANKLGETPLLQREREKYELMWTFPQYRECAPGESLVHLAVKTLGMQLGDSVIDFGCGTGRAAQKLESLGYGVTAIDFASNCFDPGIDVPFVNACLWDLPDMQADWGYCTDVMEHIPMEKVADVIKGVASRCSKGAFFNIATREDGLGRLIGKKLHMTVMPGEYWKALLSEYWINVEQQTRAGGEEIFIVKGPKYA